MQKLADKELLQDISIELGINPAFLEKDFYAVLVLEELSNLSNENLNLIFTGGTCLSKGYGLIKRFSEDIDFRIITNFELNRSKRKEIRESIIEKVKQIENLEILEETIKSQNESSFFSFDVQYPKEFEASFSLRPHLKLEFSFEKALLPFKKLPIRTITDECLNNEYKFEINCLSPIEIGANKLSALVWRINTRDRAVKLGHTKNDPTIIRHLHDLSALELQILKPEFIEIALKSFETDKGRGGADKTHSIQDFTNLALSNLTNQKEYIKEYESFVNSLSYASETEIIDYNKALQTFKNIAKFIQNYQE
ncbi:MAG TPA: nucleotidyl transferase AbiEii/AbiGii toxin family protein [Candidatus Gastranaerophilales bacterium]|nr:nucleotidyl transferase AbiEii/AbiGii toxin family protein [Candidatus Gastranaerophilales bacterium]